MLKINLRKNGKLPSDRIANLYQGLAILNLH